MLLLLDECVPRPPRRDLVGHDVRHVVDMGRSSKRNGELLRLMVAERFDALLTVDQNLEFQQNLRASGIGAVVVLAKTSRIKELRPPVLTKSFVAELLGAARLAATSAPP